MSLRKPLFIVFEGIDGSGKSTACSGIERLLREEGEPVIRLAEPTQGSSGREIRERLASPIKPDPDTMLELFISDREDDVTINILPNLAAGNIILMDRYYYSNAAYQGASGLSWKRILRLNDDYSFPRPDRVYFMDIDPERALERIQKRNEENGCRSDSFEKLSFLRDVRDIYHACADDRFKTIDASGTVPEIVKAVRADLAELFSNVE
ncbi:MAG: dTMP kinase [Spirochaetota bacterium]